MLNETGHTVLLNGNWNGLFTEFEVLILELTSIWNVDYENGLLTAVSYIAWVRLSGLILL